MPYKRQEAIQGTGLDTSTSQSINSLQSRLTSGTDGHIRKAFLGNMERAAEAGAEAGMGVDAEGNALIPNLKAGLTKFQQQYNKSATDAYVSNVSVDVRTDVNRIADTYAADIVGYNEAMDEYTKEMSKELLPEARDDILYGIAKDRRNKTLIIADNDLKKKTGQAIAAHDENIGNAFEYANRAVMNGDDADAKDYTAQAMAEIATKAENGYITPEEAVTAQTEMAKQLFETGIMREARGVFQEAGESEAFQFVQDIQDEIPEGWSVDEWDKFTGVLVADMTQQVTNQKKIVTAEEIAHDTKLSDIMIGAKTGEGDAGQLVAEFETMFQAGIAGGDKRISESKRTSFYKALADNQKSQRKESDDFTLVSNRLGGDDSVVLDPAQVNSFYDLALKNTETPFTNASKAQFVERMRMVPKGMKSEIQQYLLSGNPELIKQASDLVDRIDEYPGIVGSVLSNEQLAFANQINLLSGVMEPEKAIEAARVVTDPRNKDRIAAKVDELKVLKKDEKLNYLEDVADEFESGTVSSFFKNRFGDGAVRLSPVNQNRIAKEYGELTESLYKAGFGDLDDAKSRSMKQIVKNYGTFKMGNRNSVMKFPMGDYYTSASGTDYIAEQAKSDADALTGADIPVENIFFDWDERTAREAQTGKPSYPLIIVDEWGMAIPTGKRFMPQPEIENAIVVEENRIEGERKRGMADTREEEEFLRNKGLLRGNPNAY